MRSFTYVPALVLAAIAAAAPISQVAQSSNDLAPVKLSLGATENAPADPQALIQENLGDVDNSNKDQFGMLGVAVKMAPKVFKGAKAVVKHAPGIISGVQSLFGN